ncbi:MAG: hypothetical protein ACRD2T_11490 [Thermoanaerobaculia bacterium]
MRLWTRIRLGAAVGAALFPGALAAAQADDEEGEKEEPKQEADAGQDSGSTERQKQVLALFNASTKKFEKGKLVLNYDFESENQDLVEDWRPALDQTKMRVRWARGLEGTLTTIEDGILIGDWGEWIHKAVFLADLEVKVEFLPVSQFRPGTILAATFYHPKKKRAIGVAGGFQAVCLGGAKPALVKPPHPPKPERPIPSNLRHWVGYKYDGKVLESYHSQRKTSDTSAVPKFTEGFDVGHVGLAWNGSIQTFVFNVSITGTLDPDWVASQLGEKPKRPGGKTSGGTKKAAPAR